MFNFDYTTSYILENDWAKLSPLNSQHLNELLTISQDSRIWTYFLEKGNTEEKFTQYFEGALAKRKEKKEYPFVVFDKIKQQYAGMTRLYDINAYLKILKLGHTWYGVDFWGTGLNKACKYLLFEFAFDQIGAARLGFGVHGENTRSVAALENVGVQKEGVLRDYLYAIDGSKRVDLIQLSLLQEEWQQKVQIELQLKLGRK